MFTGIVEELGKVAAFDRLADSATLTVEGPLVAATAERGDSVAVSGVCLTVTRTAAGQFSADVMGETLARTGLRNLVVGGLVNLERPVLATGRLDGHIVQGHVDGTGVLTERRAGQRWDALRICAGPQLLRYIAYKGSVAVDGVSLTASAVSEVPAAGDADGWFEVSLIPETLARTTLGGCAVGDVVNIEVDVIAKYTERLLSSAGGFGGSPPQTSTAGSAR